MGLLPRALLLLLLIHASTAAIVCGQYEYDGGVDVAQYNSRYYAYRALDWIVEPPIDVILTGDSVMVSPDEGETETTAPLTARVDFHEFAESYPWARELLFEYSRINTFTLALIRLAPPEITDSRICKARFDVLNFFWDLEPVSELFSVFPVHCNERLTLMFSIDPFAHPTNDMWGDKPRRPLDGTHFRPRSGSSSFDGMMDRVRNEHLATIPFSMTYFSGARPNVTRLTIGTCTDVDIPGLSAAIVARYNESRIQQVAEEQLQNKKRGIVPTTEVQPRIDTQADADAWVRQQMRAQGIPFELPAVGKLAPPPPPPRPLAPVSPYDEVVIDSDALIAPNQQLANAEGLVSVQGASDAADVTIDGRIWPTLDCVKERTDGTCIARFGYVYTGDTEINIPLAPENNSFDPLEFLTDFELPTHFAPGAHANAFVIRWFCIGTTMNSWNNIHWTLMGSTAAALRSSPRCDAYTEVEAVEHNARADVEVARHHPGMKSLFRSTLSIEERQDPPSGTTPPPTCSVDGGSCDGELQPKLECTHNFENGTCVSYFGYLNIANTTITRPASFATNNYFTPGDEDRGQGSTFLPGRHNYTVTVHWSCQPSSGVPSSLTWVMNMTATAGSAAHNTCPVGCDDIPFSGTTDCPTEPPSSNTDFSSQSSAAVTTTSSSTEETTSSSSSSSSSSFSSSSSSSSSSGGIPTPCPTSEPCAFTANLVLYRDRNFTLPYRPPKHQAVPQLQATTIPYGLVSLDVPTGWLQDFCLDITEVVECICNTSTPCVPFSPSFPGVTGCNSPGVQKRILYRASTSTVNDGFEFVDSPPTYCSGQRAFSWEQQLVAPPGNKLLMQTKWSYSTLNGQEHNCTGTSQGGSGAIFTCGCPDTHQWNNSCGCCSPTNITVVTNINVTVINIINITIPDQSAAAVAAIASATASVATATLTAAAATTGITVVIEDRRGAHWTSWLTLGLIGVICGVPAIIAALCFCAYCCVPPPVAVPVECELECPPEPQCQVTDTIIAQEQQRQYYVAERIPREELNIAGHITLHPQHGWMYTGLKQQ